MMSSKKLSLTALVFGLAIISSVAGAGNEPRGPGPYPNCMYCKHQDTISSFLYSYSYCPELDECLEDSWNFYNKVCPSGWKPGYTLDLDIDCEAQELKYLCPARIYATAFDMGKFKNESRFLPEGAKCKVEIDATDTATLVVFANSTNLGVNYNHYRVNHEVLAV